MAKVKVKIRFISLTYLLKLFLLLCLSFVLLSGLCHLLDLHINVTSSLPYGLYKKVDKTDICKGDIILFCLEGEQAEFAKKRNYLTFGSCPNDMAPIAFACRRMRRQALPLTALLPLFILRSTVSILPPEKIFKKILRGGFQKLGEFAIIEKSVNG